LAAGALIGLLAVFGLEDAGRRFVGTDLDLTVLEEERFILDSGANAEPQQNPLCRTLARTG
jgi:hypothetical protein